MECLKKKWELCVVFLSSLRVITPLPHLHARFVSQATLGLHDIEINLTLHYLLFL